MEVTLVFLFASIAIIQLSFSAFRHCFSSCYTLFLSLATFPANIPVIFVTLRSRHFENDPVAKLVSSLAVSDIVNGVITNPLVNGTLPTDSWQVGRRIWPLNEERGQLRRQSG